jgi:microcystin-dependent protein
MSTNFPTSLDALTNPSAGNTLNSPSHSTQHANSNDAIEALQTKVGVNSSAVTTSHDYKIRIYNPIGEITMWATSTAPTGWLIADGSAVSRSTYSALWGVLGTSYGAGDGSTTFNLPNLQGRVPVGRDASQTEFDTLGETGGSKTSALGVSNLPAHNHSVTDGGHAHPEAGRDTNSTTAYKYLQRIGGAGSNYDVQATSTTRWDSITNPATASTTTGISIPTSGGNGTATGDTFSNLAPYIALNFIIRF